MNRNTTIFIILILMLLFLRNRRKIVKNIKTISNYDDLDCSFVAQNIPPSKLENIRCLGCDGVELLDKVELAKFNFIYNPYKNDVVSAQNDALYMQLYDQYADAMFNFLDWLATTNETTDRNITPTIERKNSSYNLPSSDPRVLKPYPVMNSFGQSPIARYNPMANETYFGTNGSYVYPFVYLPSFIHDNAQLRPQGGGAKNGIVNLADIQWSCDRYAGNINLLPSQQLL